MLFLTLISTIWDKLLLPKYVLNIEEKESIYTVVGNPPQAYKSLLRLNDGILEQGI
jgi:hypothetical protein